ncbi:hypothetical protein LVD17_21110 [Fulvivirga ulvae]|uniref:hypothetical protein n=1 Tax=Fulvivirga ulvae TaxID=2904245 RepID=UPI001F1CD837|nr:hypothetical protein [Fulvivirga ulvae]UII30797.1 hypothetical protein LVD17_21110 [Fulvivirga ulvae]
MKTSRILILMTALLCGILSSCDDEEHAQPAGLVNVQFSGTLSASDINGRTHDDVEEPTHLVINVIPLAGGEPHLDMEKIELYKMGDSYIAKAVALPKGTHIITDFLLVSASNKVVYAVPKAGSALEKAVSKPLPHQFYIGKDDVFHHDLQVIKAAPYSPRDFGYASFTGQVVNPLRVAAFAADDPALPTNAYGYIYHNGDRIKGFSLSSQKISLISFPGEEDADYTIEINKTGYASYVKDFDYSQLIDSLGDDMLLEVKLQKSFTMLAYIDFSFSNIFSISLNGDSGHLNIDFGDGTSTTHALSNDVTQSEIQHSYSSEGNFLITITGDIHLIEQFYSYYNGGMVDEIDFSGLTSLSDLSLGLTRGPSSVDLSHCEKLKHVNMAGIPQLEELILPDINFINNIMVSGPNLLNTTDIDDIVDKVYQNAVLNDEMNGYFIYSLIWYNETGAPIGPPSGSSLAKLAELRDLYGWNILPAL